MNREDLYLKPPGTYIDYFTDSLSNNHFEIDIMEEHRFAFYFWNKRKIELETFKNEKGLLDLVTIDYHKDLCFSDYEENILNDLNLQNMKDVAFFCWDKLNGNNDGHILSATHLNIINDVYVLYKDLSGENENFEHKDKFNNIHKIKLYTDVDKFFSKISNTENNFILDIDLDYFVKTKSIENGKKIYLDNLNEVDKVLTKENKNFLLSKSKLVTLAREMMYCGGVKYSNMIMDGLNEKLFRNKLLNNWSELGDFYY